MANTDLSLYNLDPSDTSQPLYESVDYVTGTSSILFSKQVNNLPTTTFQLGESPCMNPSSQSGNYFYITELEQNVDCPVEINSGLRLDPRYTGLDQSQFSTNMLAVEKASSVNSMLTLQPDYGLYVPQNSLKSSVLYYGWTRQTFKWDIQCEWDGTMSR